MSNSEFLGSMSLTSAATFLFLLLFGYFDWISVVKAEEYEKCTNSDCYGKTACSTIYQKSDFRGWYQCHTFQGTECVKLNKWWRGENFFGHGIPRVSSVNSHNTCVRIYDYSDCSGSFLDIQPGKSYGSLGYFNDATESISSCERPLDPSRTCRVEDVFGSNVDISGVSGASKVMMYVFDGIGLVASALKSKIPGADAAVKALKFLVGFCNSEVSTQTLIDANILQGSISGMAAKIRVIQNRFESLLDPSTPIFDKRIDLIVALHTCEEAKILFEDEKHSFRKNPAVSSPFLVSLSSIYYSVAKLVYQMRPEMQNRVISDIKDLVLLNENYMKWAIKYVTDKFDDLKWNNVLTFTGAFYSLSRGHPHFQRCKFTSIEFMKEEIDKLYSPIISKLKQFP